MLALVVNDALEGEDIPRRYPAFYRAMLANPKLYRAFLETLTILEESRKGELEPLSASPGYRLDFLNAIFPQSVIEYPAAGQWRVVWDQSVEQMETIFQQSNLAGQPAHYSEEKLLDDDGLTLLRSQVTVAGLELDVRLDAWRSPANPPALELLLAVLDYKAQLAHCCLQASIQWGEYQATATLDRYGLARFPALLLKMILDEPGAKVAAGLRLNLAAAPDS
ncbi:MAG: hypothetical protein L0332_28940 [Chloroflexi bacterium]|nr:hypothetical protein [Chloroflexota bacterium]MCI0576606.1 hypothetical protein [Chloroflexota bacterium]MCI0647026.1 hypothetical protein [Chloroflexota bacterium]MCI0730726.1 hypothetical protein [Chloroflexota bacterium]